VLYSGGVRSARLSPEEVHEMRIRLRERSRRVYSARQSGAERLPPFCADTTPMTAFRRDRHFVFAFIFAISAHDITTTPFRFHYAMPACFHFRPPLRYAAELAISPLSFMREVIQHFVAAQKDAMAHHAMAQKRRDAPLRRYVCCCLCRAPRIAMSFACLLPHRNRRYSAPATLRATIHHEIISRSHPSAQLRADDSRFYATRYGEQCADSAACAG